LFEEYSHNGNAVAEVCEKAYAKVNLLLLVGKKQPDGFHPVVTVLQNLALHDDVRIRVVDVSSDRGGEPVEVTSDDPSLPGGLDNLAGRAALRYLERSDAPPCRVSIHITKRIPVAAGLAGGSTDAAAVLRGLSRLRPGLPRESLLEVAAELGADVPACLIGGTVLGLGRGDEVAPLESGPLWWVLANPGVQLSTASVYACYDALRGEGAWEAALLRRPMDELAPGFRELLARGDAEGLAGRLRNDLGEPACRLRPEVERLVRAMVESGARGAIVSGSGPTVAGLALNEAHAAEVADRLRGAAPWVWWGPSVHRTVWADFPGSDRGPN